MKKILIIDDEEDFCFFVKTNLELSGEFQVITATTWQKGMSAVHKERPNAILLDIMMPELNGMEVLKKLKEDRKTRSIPVIVLSAKGDDESRKRAVALHCEDYIVKPVEMKVLESTLKKILSQPAKEKK